MKDFAFKLPTELPSNWAPFYPIIKGERTLLYVSNYLTEFVGLLKTIRNHPSRKDSLCYYYSWQDYFCCGIISRIEVTQLTAAPNGCAVTSTGNLLVTLANHTVVELNKERNVTLTIGTTRGTEDGQFDKPMGIAVNSAGIIHVVDSNNNRIQRFDSGCRFRGKFGTKGQGNNQFNCPERIAITSKDDIIITDTGNYRIQIFDKNGNYISTFGSYGTTDGCFKNPRGIAIDAKDNIQDNDMDYK